MVWLLILLALLLVAPALIISKWFLILVAIFAVAAIASHGHDHHV